jgi:hypothetical protein
MFYDFYEIVKKESKKRLQLENIYKFLIRSRLCQNDAAPQHAPWN